MRRSFLFRPGIVAALAVVAGAPAASAHRSLVGGFRPVASERSARAVWTNPAAVGITGRGTAVAEVLVGADGAAALLGSDGDGEWDVPTDFQGLSVAVATDHLAYGYQYEADDVVGVPDWTFAVGNRVKMGGSAHLGATLEWRGGDDSGFDASAGVLIPLGRRLIAAAVAHDVLERRVDGADVTSSWQVGLAAPARALLGTFTYDALIADAVDTVHWFGFAVDGSKSARFSFARSSDGDWNATFDLAFPNHLLGLGAADREDVGSKHPDRAFLAAEWRGRALPGTRRARGH